MSSPTTTDRARLRRAGGSARSRSTSSSTPSRSPSARTCTAASRTPRAMASRWPWTCRRTRSSHSPGRGAGHASGRGSIHADPDLLRRGEGRRQLQRDGRGQGRARSLRALSRRPTSDRMGCASMPSRRGPSGPWPRRGSPASRRCTGRSTRSRRCARNITIEDCRRSAVYLASDLSSAVTGEVLYVDGGYNVMGVPSGD